MTIYTTGEVDAQALALLLKERDELIATLKERDEEIELLYKVLDRRDRAWPWDRNTDY